MKIQELLQNALLLCIVSLFFISPALAQQDCEESITFDTAGTFGFIVPAGVTSLHITAVGADGGNLISRGGPDTSFGGNGASIAGTFVVNSGDSLTIIVGETGDSERNSTSLHGAGGGGGSAVVNNTLNTLLLIAGAGGGAALDNRIGGGGRDTTGCVAGGGMAPEDAGGGGGFNEDGEDGNVAGGGKAGILTSGAADGGIGDNNGGAGFGGGGAGGTNSNDGGGGGGYGGGDSGDNSGGQGGCSFNSGTDQNNQAGMDGGAGFSARDGSVLICYTVAPPIPTMSQWGLFLFALVVFTVFVVGIYNLKKSEVRGRKAE